MCSIASSGQTSLQSHKQSQINLLNNIFKKYLDHSQAHLRFSESWCNLTVDLLFPQNTKLPPIPESIAKVSLSGHILIVFFDVNYT